MKPEQPQDELKALMDELSVSQEQARTIFTEIKEGETWLKTIEEPALPEGFLERIEKACQAGRRKPAMRFAWLYRVAAVILFAFVALLLFQIVSKTPNQQPDPTEKRALDIYSDELDLWDVALAQEEEIDLASDETAMTEILLLWDDAGWDTDNLLHKETHDEDNGFSAIGQHSARLV